ncbi:MAG: hypothetical protein OQJ96_06170 [Flavobacteriales bacterium]|nr:hypothetical protein [Flavobacteriales bacterium]MCW8937664.1 hypothetical protein [Flavobacteriales bacterium]MCW8967574.1 hypothetical protein [Flavobacteriales bacterium]MCW8990152.1 hypothetical protein [Flavobacteriales bacterium]MCW9019870.1 hypothetical protein [Flavobacteriales bacterium]
MALSTNCQNPECNKVFQRKNSKKIYCSLNCKNRANYIKFSIENAEEVLWQKKYKKNVKIIDGIFTNGLSKVLKTTLEQVGFDVKYVKSQEKDDNEVIFFEIGNYWLIYLSETEYAIEKINNNERN